MTNNIAWELLYGAANSIEKDLTSFNMTTFGMYDHDCKTIACLGGHVVWNSLPEVFDFLIKAERNHDAIGNLAYGILRLTSNNDARELFHADSLDKYHKDDGISFLNDNRIYVPDAVRWMAANKTISWEAAFEAVAPKTLVLAERDFIIDQYGV